MAPKAKPKGNSAAVMLCVRRRAKWAQGLKSLKPCRRCGLVDESQRMHWHHRDSSTKLFAVSNGSFLFSRARILAEIEKCDLLCELCHMAEHDRSRRPCGTPRKYRNGCRCPECRGANCEYQRLWRAKNKAA